MYVLQLFTRVSEFFYDCLKLFFQQPQVIDKPDIWVNKMFCNISLPWMTIRYFRMQLLKLWKWQVTLDCEMESSPDTLRELLDGICLYGLQHTFGIHSFRQPKHLETQGKFNEPCLQYGDYLRLHFTQNKLLCFDLLTRPKMPFKVMHRKEVTHSNGSYERKSRGRKLADEMGRGTKNPIILS